MSPAATLAAQLRTIAAAAAAQSSPVAIGAALAEGFGAIASTLEHAESVVGDAFAQALAALPLTVADVEALRAAGVPVADLPAPAEPAADQVAAESLPDAHLADVGASDQAVDFPADPVADRAQRMHAAFSARALPEFQVPTWDNMPQVLRDSWLAAAGAV